METTKATPVQDGLPPRRATGDFGWKVPAPDPTLEGTIIAIAVVAAFALLILLGLSYLLYKNRMKKKKKADSDYEKIIPSSGKCSPTSTEGSRLITPTVSMKTIPFTVPSSAGASGSRRPLSSESRSLDGADTTSIGSGGSEPSVSLKGSMESLGACPDFRGAYTLGSIDPSLYKMNDADDDYDIPEHHIGRVWFAVEYERESEKLMVTLMKAKNLPSRSLTATNSCDPFCRIYLLPDERRYLQSKFKKKTCSPKFEESFVFQVSNKSVDERVLRLTFYNIDRQKRHHVIGHALYPLKEHNYESNERVVMWRDLEKEVQETTLERGEMHISLCYNDHLERLTVGIFEGKNFKKSEGSTSPDFYSKVCLMQHGKVVKTKKTDVVKRSSNPAFNESFTFKVSSSALDMSSINVTAMQHLTGSRDKLLGRIVLGSFMFARGKELEHWNEMMTSQREQVGQWHTLT